ncbi:hypothetical protein RchiOBHm_Chr5g0069521 [Rosa chinensis]|uniref:Uncharacterized protein n=1 Tax=Rosa chinensis TaxID=74649 RepID=A0A2P6QJX6_ROSCH|nr:hypothetical protein RchiOBHm_Chr5g0069521 [Rosa chinensis]
MQLGCQMFLVFVIDASVFIEEAKLWLIYSAKAMAGDTVVRSLLEKMAECASNAYLGILVSMI